MNLSVWAELTTKKCEADSSKARVVGYWSILTFISWVHLAHLQILTNWGYKTELICFWSWWHKHGGWWSCKPAWAGATQRKLTMFKVNSTLPKHPLTHSALSTSFRSWPTGAEKENWFSIGRECAILLTHFKLHTQSQQYTSYAVSGYWTVASVHDSTQYNPVLLNSLFKA